MYYSAIGVLAILILFIVNRDILLDRKLSVERPTWKMYRRFLFTVLAYYVTDVLWGVFEHFKLSALLFADTTVYYLAMGAGVWLEGEVCQPGELAERALEQSDDSLGTLDGVSRLRGVQVLELRQGGHLLVNLGIVLHGA